MLTRQLLEYLQHRCKLAVLWKNPSSPTCVIPTFAWADQLMCCLQQGIYVKHLRKALLRRAKITIVSLTCSITNLRSEGLKPSVRRCVG